MTEHILRQRRNLLLTCIVLWALKFGGIIISKYSFAGFDVSVSNPSVIPTLVWFAFFYFLYRYYQYFSGEGIDKLREVTNKALNDKCAPAMKRLVERAFPNTVFSINIYNYSGLRGQKWKYKLQKLNKDSSGLVISTEDVEIPISRLNLAPQISAALFDTAFRNPVATDYLLPFLAAVGVLLYCGGSDWPGGLMIVTLGT